ncbi:MAG: translocation/assembly module TamB domain-containing protein [Candidatus Omnitrophica bacterium]|nr:translocation/assembly module TamB domain-containing protein [Candidatus Omnitrophota bacterium]
MRRAQLIKRKKVSTILFLIAFSWVGLGMGFDIKSGLIAKDFSAFLEKRLNSIFIGKEVRLSGVEGGLSKLAIENFSVSKRQAGPPIFSADKIIIKYGLADLMLNQFEKLGEIYLVSPALVFTPNTKGQIALSKPGGAPYFLGTSFSKAGPLKFNILNGSIGVSGKRPVLTNLGGSVTFQESNLIFNGLTGAFINIPVLVNGRIDNIMGDPVIKLRLTVKDKYYSATFTFNSGGKKSEGVVHGSLTLFDRFDARFKGRINVDGETLEISDFAITNPLDPKSGFVLNGDINLSDKSGKFSAASMAENGKGFIEIVGRITEKKALAVYAKLNHIDFFGNDLLSELDLSTTFYKGPNEMVTGSLKTRNLVVNYKPFHDIDASWVLKKKELFLTNFSLGDAYRLFGKLKLASPYDLDLNLSINNADLADWLVFSRAEEKEGFAGLISGKIKIKGPLQEPVTEGNINVEEGNINDIKFSAINFNLRGRGPLFTIADSRLIKEGGVLFISGEVDLRKIGKRNIFENVKIETDHKVIVWEGWDITKSTSEIKAEKSLGEDFGVNFKTYVNAGETNEERKESEIGLDYKIKKDENINIKMKTDSAFVGIEHKIKF